VTPPNIIRIPILPLGLANAHLIQGPGGCILVDAGLPGSEAKLGRTLAQLGLSPQDIKLIVITHAHVDHAGAAHAVREATGAPIVAHAGDAPHFSRATPMTYCPTGWAGRLFLKLPLAHEPYEGFAPDIQLTEADTLDLSCYGIDGVIEPTPGHTKGSISVRLSSREALVGDLVASGILIGGLMRRNHAIRPPFEEDPQAVGLALQRLLDAGMERFYMGHGGPLAADEVRRHAQRLLALKQGRGEG
jgi:glyoxylase-like metal-dependent hydrolase (beta-lactamase superfamily II)